MNVSARGMAFIKALEKHCLRARFDDRRGCLVIGWGHRGKDVTEGLFIQAYEVEELSLFDLVLIEDALRDLVDVYLDQNQYDALASLMFDVGAGQTFQTSALLYMVNHGRFAEAAEEIRGWVSSGCRDTFSRARRVLERNLFTNGYAP